MAVVDLKIKKETPKAVLVRYEIYDLFRKDKVPEGACVVDETEKYSLVAVPAETWLPKSQIQVKDGKVVEVADWLKQKKGLYTLEEIQEAVREAIAKIKAENPRLRINWLMVKNELPERFSYSDLLPAVRFYTEKFKEEVKGNGSVKDN